MKERKSCCNCKFFEQHFVEGINRIIKVSNGRCTAKNKMTNAATLPCENFSLNENNKEFDKVLKKYNKFLKINVILTEIINELEKK